MDNKQRPVLCGNEQCTGCMACANACSRNAITIYTDEEGFYRPQVDEGKCVGCMRCEHVCPVLHPVEPPKTIGKVFAAWHKDENIRRESSSGGAFTALAETVIAGGGVVVGAAYTENLQVRHICVDNNEGLADLRLSKYVQSEIGYIYRSMKSFLKEGKQMLFCGTPCQVTGLRKLFPDEKRLVCCDFICHGVPSPLMLKKYLDWLVPQIGEIGHVNFRAKNKGWYDALRVMTLKNGEKRTMRGKKDAFWVGFNNNNMQPGCYQCRFVGYQRVADITIADFWGIGKQLPFGHKEDIEKGVSMVMANNTNGLKLIQQSEERMCLFERTLEEVSLRNQTLTKPCKRPKSRDTFYADLNRLTFEEMIARYLIPDNKTKLVKLWREYLPFSLIKSIRMRDQK